MTQRAKAGGEYGANGEWYDGGKFINTIPENSKREGSVKRKPRKVEIAPYQWELERDGYRSIYRQFAGIYGKVVDGVAIMRADSQLPQTLAYYGATIEQARSLINRWNDGERWESCD